MTTDLRPQSAVPEPPTGLRDHERPQPSAAGSGAVEPSHAQRRQVDWRRLRRPLTAACLVAVFIGGVAESLGAVAAGRIAENPSLALLVLLAVALIGAAVIDTAARTAWCGVVDQAEGTLRADLLASAMAQPLSALTEQAVGEVLDRIDDDTHEVGAMMRWGGWQAIRTALTSGPLWVVGGLTWWPAFFLTPASAWLTWLTIRRILPQISERKVIEEIAWTDQAAALEEGIAARDDLRTSLGQSYVMRRCAELCAEVFARFDAVVKLEGIVTRRAGLALHAVLAATALSGVALTLRGNLSTAELVTLFLVTTSFVGHVHHFATQLPDLQAGFGAVLRLRSMLAAPAEPEGGQQLPAGPLSIEFRDLDFGYPTGNFALTGIKLEVPAGTTCALVGRTGSGKSTLASLISRAVEPQPGSVFLGGVDVLELDVESLRSAVGVVTQRTEILAGTLAENIALFADLPRATVESAVAELGISQWVAGLPDGLDTLLGPGGTNLSAGEEQLVAFARLFVRDVRVVVLDEATARMDPVTEAQVVSAAHRLLAGRTGILVAHRLSTTERAEQVAVLDAGRVVENGARAVLAAASGPFARLVAASAENVRSPATIADAEGSASEAGRDTDEGREIAHARRTQEAPPSPHLAAGPSLARSVAHAMVIHPSWGLLCVFLFLGSSLLGAFGAITGWLWGQVVDQVGTGQVSPGLLVALVASMLASPFLLAYAVRAYPLWWIAVMLRARARVLSGQTVQHRITPTPPGEVVARAMDADRFARYTDRWVDFLNGLAIVAVTAAVAQSWLAGAVLLAVVVAAAGASAIGRPIAGRSAEAASATRARFGRAVVSALDSIRTVKLAAATPAVHQHLQRVDSGRVEAAVREHRVQAVLDGVPVIMVQMGVVAAWVGYFTGYWGLAVTLLVSGAVGGFDWFGRVAGAVVTEAPGTRAWMTATSELAGGGDLLTLPRGLDLVHGRAEAPATVAPDPLTEFRLAGVSAVHDDGTIGVERVDLTIRSGEFVLLLGSVGSGKSTLLRALAGLVSSTGELYWNNKLVQDPEVELRPPRISYVAQLPRVLSGTFAGNVQLDHLDREVDPAIELARLGSDVAAAGGSQALVGHRGVRLSGGQVQRLAMARALACKAELLLADDVSSALDAATEIELWAGLRAAGLTVLAASNKAAALVQADRVVVLEHGLVVDQGPWSELNSRWQHLAG